MDSVLAPLLDVWDHISLQHLLEERAPLSSPVYLGLLVLFILVLIAGSVLTIWARRWSRGNRLHEAVLGRYAGAAAWIAGYGVIAVGLRFTQAIFFSKRLWVFLAVVGLLVCVVHFIWYWVKRYPIEIGAYLEDQRRRRYLTPARASTAARRTRRPRAR